MDSGSQIDQVEDWYAEPTEEMRSWQKAKFSYKIGEVVTSASVAGLDVDYVGEGSDSGQSQIARVQSGDDDGVRRCRLDGVDLPELFTLAATKAAAP